MANQKFHGIELAAGAVISNLHVERLANDPVPVSAGRMWFNTTAKALKYSTLDGGGAVIVKIIGDASEVNSAIEDLETSLAAEIARATAAEAAIAADLDTEEAARASGDADTLTSANTYTDAAVAALVNGAPEVLNTLQELAAALENDPGVIDALRDQILADVAAAKAELKGDVSTAMDTLEEVEDALAAESAARIAADAAEVTAREDGDDALDGRLTTVEGQVNGKIGDLSTLTTTDKDSLVDAINEVDADLATEVSTRTAAVSTLTTNLGNEVTRATAAEDALTDRIDNADDSITALQTDLGAEVTRATAAEAAIAADLDTEEAARAAADTAIRNDSNALEYSFTAGAASLSHTITHGLDTDNFLYSILVEGSDSVYRNDVVPMEIIDSNNVKVDLTEARKIKANFRSMAGL